MPAKIKNGLTLYMDECPLERRANSPDQTETLLPTTTLNGGSGKDFSN